MSSIGLSGSTRWRHLGCRIQPPGTPIETKLVVQGWFAPPPAPVPAPRGQLIWGRGGGGGPSSEDAWTDKRLINKQSHMPARPFLTGNPLPRINHSITGRVRSALRLDGVRAAEGILLKGSDRSGKQLAGLQRLLWYRHRSGGEGGRPPSHLGTHARHRPCSDAPSWACAAARGAPRHSSHHHCHCRHRPASCSSSSRSRSSSIRYV